MQILNDWAQHDFQCLTVGGWAMSFFGMEDRLVEDVDFWVALQVEEDPIGRVQAYTFGYERDLPVGPSFLNVGVGVQATAYGLPPQLKPVYGQHPAGFTVFLHLRPTGNIGTHMQMMHQQH